MEGKAVYLDYQATTPVDPRALERMLPYFSERFGNPHSVHHAYGREAEAAVEDARAHVATLIGAEAREVVFTSGATEANNLAIKGTAEFQQLRKGIAHPHVIVPATEHKCVLESCHAIERKGGEVTFLPVGSNGLVDLEALAREIRGTTVLISVMAVNNEIGVVQPLEEIGRLCRERGVTLHSDAAQAAGKIPLDVQAMNIGLMSISAHKMYGPKGIGAIYVRRRPRARLEPQIDGGGQERGMRSGTVAPALCVGFGAAAEIAAREMDKERERFARMNRRFLEELGARVGDFTVNGDMERRFPGNLNIGFKGVDAERLIEAMPGVAVSTASACSSAAVEPSYVLRALGLDEEAARSSIRIGFGRFTSEDDVTRAVDSVALAVERTRRAGAQAAE